MRPDKPARQAHDEREGAPFISAYRQIFPHEFPGPAVLEAGRRLGKASRGLWVILRLDTDHAERRRTRRRRKNNKNRDAPPDNRARRRS
jgi:hypothetical protein